MKYVPLEQRGNPSAFDAWLDDMERRHAVHNDAIDRVAEKLERVAAAFGKLGIV